MKSRARPEPLITIEWDDAHLHGSVSVIDPERLAALARALGRLAAQRDRPSGNRQARHHAGPISSNMASTQPAQR